MGVAPGLSSFDQRVRLYIYEAFVRRGTAPRIEDTARAFSCTVEEGAATYLRLEAAHALILYPDDGEILRAAPFWAVPTAFRVTMDDRCVWGSCIWDALGIPAMLGRDAHISTACGCCDLPMNLDVQNGSLQAAPGIIHIAVPASRWYDNVVFT